MNILWDFRLFSYGYGTRGVGTFASRMAQAIIDENPPHTISIWADRESVPAHIKSWPVTWIPYKRSSWKHDLYTIPLLIIQNKIDIFHYWIALGPIHNIGMGVLHPCKTIATVYDLGVELWHDIPFAASKRKTWYWKVQKYLIRHCPAVICISEATRHDVTSVIKPGGFDTAVAYVPLSGETRDDGLKREPCFVTLGGSVHKNLTRVIQAFIKFRKTHPEFSLIILGDIDRASELPAELPAYILFDDMSRYHARLASASGLIFCSLHEGLGLPALEAMSFHCPLLLSDIPSLKEIAGDYAYFVNPLNSDEIAQGMNAIAGDCDFWVNKAKEGKQNYEVMSKDSAKIILGQYHQR